MLFESPTSSTTEKILVFHNMQKHLGFSEEQNIYFSIAPHKQSGPVCFFLCTHHPCHKYHSHLTHLNLGTSLDYSQHRHTNYHLYALSLIFSISLECILSLIVMIFYFILKQLTIFHQIRHIFVNDSISMLDWVTSGQNIFWIVVFYCFQRSVFPFFSFFTGHNRHTDLKVAVV